MPVIANVNNSCGVGKNLDYENCKCRKRLVEKLTEECTENIDEAKLARVALFEHVNESVCSRTVCIVWIIPIEQKIIIYIKWQK